MSRRARSEEQKEERRQAIVDAAWRSFVAGDYASVTMAEVAESAGLAKGTVYLYFATKEELFLAVIMEQLAAWFAAIDARLQRLPTPSPIDDVADTLSASLASQRGLTRLLAILATVLEQNIGEESALLFKQMLLEQITRVGAQLESHLPELPAGEGAHLLLRIHAAIVGLQHLAEPAPVIDSILHRPEFGLFRIDFEPELNAYVRLLMRGLLCTHRSNEQ